MHRHVVNQPPEKQLEPIQVHEYAQHLGATYSQAVDRIYSFSGPGSKLGEKIRFQRLSYALGETVMKSPASIDEITGAVTTEVMERDALAVVVASEIAARTLSSFMGKLLPSAVSKKYAQYVAGAWLLGHQVTEGTNYNG